MAAHSMYSDMTNLALTKLCLAADYYAAVSPALARFYVDKVDRMKEEFAISPTAHHLRCQFCGAVFRPDNHLVRIKVQMKETRKIRQLQRHRDKPGQELGRFQQHLLDSYTNRKNRLTIRCEACNKRTTLWFVGEREKTTKRTGEDIPAPDMTKLSRSAKKKLKKKLKKKQKSETPSEDTVQSNNRSQPTSAALTHSSTQRSSELHNRSTLSSGPHSTKSHPRFLAASSQSKTSATTPSGGSLLAGLNSKSARNKKKRNKQSYNPLKEMLEKQKLDKNRPSGKGIMDLLMNTDK